MGNILTTFTNLFSTKTPYSICMVGLDAAGKTTILYQMKLKDTVPTIPTIGFNVEKFQVNNVEFSCWDIGGQDKIRPVWCKYIELSDGMVFVVDICDKERWGEAGAALRNILEEYKNKPVLILANKADNPKDTSIPEKKERMLEELNIESVCELWECRTVSGIVSATDNNPLERLLPAFEWMVDSLEKTHSMRKRRSGL